MEEPVTSQCITGKRNHGYDVTEVDLTKCLNSQGPFDLIIHKLSDLLVEAGQDLASHHLVQRLQVYLDTHPFTILLDPLPAVHTLLDRFQSYHLLRNLETQQHGVSAVFSPPCVELMSKRSDVVALVRERLTFPIICKTRVAHGPRSHEMSLIFNEKGLKDVMPPCLLQSFINHSATLYKIFVVGSQHFVVKRPSVRNFPQGETDQTTIFFHSHQVSKAESCSHLCQTPLYPDVLPPSDDVVRQVVQSLQGALGMSLFGVDLIVDTQSGRCAVIDVNAFPGYEGVAEFFPALLSHVDKLLKNNKEYKSTLEGSPDGTTSDDLKMDLRSLPEPCKRQVSSTSYFSMRTPAFSADC
ncbi:inositol-tetrakisphosphate 1-kinase-like isoform X2 [Hyla sarda]|uniref:inositol-tetrakisphosphate 1-kinase-like isoform X2 n=1 Tax=Hyla sarda TaxID=327740 RepID=UPI0024C340AE|nr:inositol-tetrakisphosphate 1-kinase-like isoform X2 [Hyla sarda]XP_056396159.1 inositol-tetrakisphosphate 1-kinase-like isoform X2 [Hyla sarda]XP_056396160.1 inositol-tetrakisphosphate 1-kinase-like isoform X2 [Hyla sarda]XP_056396161.1 inositol-tetrakisphosphate 1-kinase-like isoform X2 [Hyla sarda]XP_056396162.1 inositol-tetrakisphosphate 1-kinase-like isoform X2 [Hyla sarda]XP_056396163.1 inositol-tetrakisphosphate 1-kinase-like isoform X2 [Hyla sarda]XP_056396164.1 inositol-tetrakispho